MFRDLSSDQLKILADSAVQRELKPGEALYRQGDTASNCFVLLTGSIRFTVRLKGRNTTAGIAFADDLFGLEALRSRGRRPDTATAVGPADLIEIDRDSVKRLMAGNPEFQLELLDYLVDRLNEKSVHAVRTGHYDAEQRIAAYLINEADSGAHRGNRIDKSLSQADLADYLALTPETFCRKVSKFRRLGWIGGSGNEYVIKERDALRGLLDQ